MREIFTETGVSENSPTPDFSMACPTSMEVAASIVLQSRKSFLVFEVVAMQPVSGVRYADFTCAPSGSIEMIVS